MVLVEYQQANFVYFTNAVNKIYYSDKTGGDGNFYFQNTGWHFIPNQRWDNWVTDKQWFDLVTNHSAFKIHSCEATVQNMIPLTDNLSIQQDTTFMSFNNTIYALGYTDTQYETLPVESATSLIYREGIKVDPATGALVEKQVLPLYRHPIARINNNTDLKIYNWDPFTKPASLMELRPGKNSITYAWKRTDSTPFVSTSRYYCTQPCTDTTNVPKYYNNVENFKDEWITPPSSLKQDPRFVAFNNKNAQWYQHYFDHPINNWFIKMIPILDKKGNLLNHTAQVCIIKKITFEVLPRVNSTNFPQLPYTWMDLNRLSSINNSYSLAVRPIEQMKIPPFSYQAEEDTYYVPPAESKLKTIQEEDETDTD